MRLSLAAKISTALVGILLLAIFSGVVAIMSAYRFEHFQNTIVVENLASVRAAEELEIALLEQRGYVALYILDDANPYWLKQLEAQREQFNYWFAKARAAARSPQERRILNELETEQRAYAQKRYEVVALYDEGRTEDAKSVLFGDVTTLRKRSYDLCERFIDANQSFVNTTSALVRRQVERVTLLVTMTLLVTISLGIGLLWLFFQGVIFPLRRMAADARLATGDESSRREDTQPDELRELGHLMQLLMADVAETRHDLARSRTQLALADKLTAVGKLAASVAHEIRNPLTSVKMWLFSLRRSIGDDANLQQKIDVISDEVVRLDNIVRQFLEFSRPPKPRLSPQNVSRLLDKTLELIKYRLEKERIQVTRHEESEIPPATADGEQLSQVFINLLNNSIEAMPAGGQIHISLSRGRRGGRDMLVASIADTGPGMSQDIQRRMFEPFFTTKPEGTGLGLCIAASVMARHGGSLVLDWTSRQGTQWSVWLPPAQVANDG